jgi:hypothetical protein
MRRILDQLARRGLLWDDDTVTAIFAGDMPPLEDVVLALVIGAVDAEVVVRGDPKSTWNEKRIARQCLAIAFLSAISCAKQHGTAL